MSSLVCDYCGEGFIEYFQEEETFWEFDIETVNADGTVDLEHQIDSVPFGECGFVCKHCGKFFSFGEIIALRDSRRAEMNSPLPVVKEN